MRERHRTEHPASLEDHGKYFACILEVPVAQMDKQQLNYAIAQCAVIMNEAPSGIIGHAVRCLVQDIDEAVKVERYRRFDA